MVSAICEFEEIGRKERNFDNIPDRVDLPLTISLLFRLIFREFGLQCLKFMFHVQILEGESQKFLSNGYFGSPT